jgi:hypothetical protein
MAELESAAPASSDVSSDVVVDSGFDHLSDDRNEDALGAIDNALAGEPQDNVLEADPAPEPKREQRDGDGAGLPGGAPPPSPPVAPAPAPPADGFQAVDFQMAKALGIGFADMRAFGSVDLFRQYVNQEVAQRRQQQALAQQQQRFQVQPFKLENPDQYDPAIVGMNQHFAQQLAQMQRFYDQQLNAVHQQYGGLQQQVQKHLPTIEQYRQQQEQAVRASRYEEFDRTVDRLVDEEFVGRGTFSALSNPRHQQARRAIARKVDALMREEREPGEAVPPLETLVEEAVSVVFRKQLADRERAQLTQKLKQRGRNTLAVPSQSLHSDDDATGKEKALAEIDKFVRASAR